MSKSANPLLEKRCKVYAGRNMLLKFTASALSGGKIRFLSDSIEFDLLTTKRRLRYPDIDHVENRGQPFSLPPPREHKQIPGDIVHAGEP